MIEWEKDFNDIKIDPEQWKEIEEVPDIKGIKYKAKNDPHSKLKIQKPKGEWVEVDFIKDSVITIIALDSKYKGRIAYNPNNVLDGRKLEFDWNN